MSFLCHQNIVSPDWKTGINIIYVKRKNFLIHWGRVTHICFSKLTIIGADNGLSPYWCEAIIRTNAGILLIGPLERDCSEILIQADTFLFKKTHLKMSFGKWRPFCLGLIELKDSQSAEVVVSIFQLTQRADTCLLLVYNWLLRTLRGACRSYIKTESCSSGISKGDQWHQ